MGLALRHVGIVVSNLDEALHVYKNYLQCSVVKIYPEVEGNYINDLVGIPNVLIKVAILKTRDENRIELIEYVKEVGQKRDKILANNIGASHFALSVENIDQLYIDSERYNVKFLSEPLLSPEGFVKVAYAVIMDECLVELVEVLDERRKKSG